MNEPVAKSSTLIRRPIAEVFDAFVDPETITKFWLADTTGPLAPGARVTWTFMVPGAEDDVTVVAFEKDRHVAFDWSDGISVNLYFERSEENLTTLRVTAEGFHGENASSDAVNATEGFAIVLCDLKSLLETGKSGGFVGDKAELISRSMKVSSKPS